MCPAISSGCVIPGLLGRKGCKVVLTQHGSDEPSNLATSVGMFAAISPMPYLRIIFLLVRVTGALI